VALVSRASYHHGDLRRALIESALALVRSDGPDGLTMRELARRLEVSPAAIYRHFPDRDAILAQVARRSRESLASRMRAAQDGVERSDPAARAVSRLLATGSAYITFAREEPHLLSAAFLPLTVAGGEPEEPSPWRVLAAALDDLVRVGAMPGVLRPGAEVLAWSTVHGYAILSTSRAFHMSGEPSPDEQALLEGVARSLGLAS
jgi:AcrR family transcriptional regulator